MGPEKPRLERVMWRKMRLNKQIPKKWLMRLKLRLKRILKKPRLQRVMIIMIGDEDGLWGDWCRPCLSSSARDSSCQASRVNENICRIMYFLLLIIDTCTKDSEERSRLSNL